MKNLYAALFFFVLCAGILSASQLIKTHKDFDSVDREFEEIYRNLYEVMQGNRAPATTDKARVGTLWINTSSTTVYFRFPDPTGWRKIGTDAP